MKLYNTLSRKVEEFQPLKPGELNLYTCGPTVYDYQHIGNFRKFVFDDTLRRVLQFTGLDVHHVMNITDVGHLVSDADEGEDKLEKGAKREGKSVGEIAQYYTEDFKKDIVLLNILEPNAYRGQKDSYARATSFIDEQINLIKILFDKGFAYQTTQAIYFDITKLKSYGELTGQRLSDKEVAVRPEVVADQNKHNPQDFAVWFFLQGHYKDHSLHWDSPWGAGFPGWHLECSAIIHTLLGEPLDIHTGGVDNIGTHHVNEMAQTEAAYAHKLSSFWLHSEHLLVEGKKMSKSLGNSYRLQDIMKRGYDPLALRLLYSQGHYRTQINFTWENLDAAQNRLQDIRAFADLKWQVTPGFQGQALETTKIETALQDDLNTPLALSALSEIIDGPINPSQQALQNFLDFLDSVFGLQLAGRPDISDEQKQMIIKRQATREQKDFTASDQLRDELKQQEIGLRDTDHGPIWYRLV